MTLQERFHVDGEPRDAELADMDGDGWLDVVIAIRDGDKVQAYRNDHGRLVLSAETTVGKSPRELTTADFNEDGCPDFAVVNRQSFDVSLLLGCGGGAVGFQSLNQILPVDGEVSGLQLTDVNADGRADVIQTHRASSDVSVRLALAGGSLTEPVFYSAAPATNYLELVDVNGDGRRDMITAGLGQATVPGSISVRLGLVAGSFGPSVTAPLPDPANQPEARILAVKAADFDGDGRADLAASFTDSRLAFLRGNGDGTFAAVANYSGGFPLFQFAVRQMVAGDFDADGDMDLAGAGFYGELGVLTNTGGLLTAATLTPVTYSAAALDPRLWYRARELRMEDLNVDNDPDLVIGLDAGVAVFTGGAGATFAPGQFNPSPGVPALPGAGFSVNGFAFGDFDADGDRDLAVSCFADKCLTLLARRQDGPMFAEALRVTVPSAEFVASGDIDGDGRADLAGSGRAALWIALSGRVAAPAPAAPLNFARASVTGVVINEIMSSNTSTPLPVADDRFSDWVELYNPADTAASIGGWVLSADEGNTNPSLFTFPANAAIPPRSRLLVLCSNAVVPGYFSTGWKLTDAGGSLSLRAALTVMDSVEWPPQRPNTSYGRFADGTSTWSTSSMASPGSPNVYTGSIPPTLRFEGFNVSTFTPGTAIRLYAQAADDVAVIGVSLSWRRLDVPGTWQRVLFYDDGVHGDALLGDGLFAGTIPDGLPATAQIEFYLEATDTSGLTVYDPVAPSSGEDSGTSLLYTLAFSPEPAVIEISELVSSNAGWWADSSGRTPDYIELHNFSSLPVALDDYGLVDSSLSAANRYRFPAGAVLPPGGRRLILCSGSADGNLHANFKLSSSGDSVYLQKLTPIGSWLTVEKVDIPVLGGFAYARPAANAAFQPLPGTPWQENTSRGQIMIWRTQPAPPSPPVVYIVFPTTAGRAWMLETSPSPAGPWSPAANGGGDGRDAGFHLGSSVPRAFYRVKY